MLRLRDEITSYISDSDKQKNFVNTVNFHDKKAKRDGHFKPQLPLIVALEFKNFQILFLYKIILFYTLS